MVSSLGDNIERLHERDPRLHHRSQLTDQNSDVRCFDVPGANGQERYGFLFHRLRRDALFTELRAR